ncbi:MAG: hypothetical protein AB7O45_17855, partial [Alphaproteobacteria bacterium]
MGGSTRPGRGWLRDCDVIIRRGGVVTGWRLRRAVQVAVLALAIGCLSWAGAATVGAWMFWGAAEREATARAALEWKAHELREATDKQWARLEQLVREIERQRGDAAATAAAETELRRTIVERQTRLLTDAEARIAGIRNRLAEERRDHAAALDALRLRIAAVEEERDRAATEGQGALTRLAAERDEARAAGAAAVRAREQRLEAERRLAADRLASETTAADIDHAIALGEMQDRLGRAEASVADLADRNRSLTQQALQHRGDVHRLQTVVARLLRERTERNERAAALVREAEIASHRAETQRAAAEAGARELATLRTEHALLDDERQRLREAARELEERLAASQTAHRDVMEGLGARA